MASEFDKYLDKGDISKTTVSARIANSCFIVGEYLGRGSFGKVYECVNTKTGVKCAVKIIKKKGLLHIQGGESRISREIGILKKTKKCENVIKLIDVLETKKKIYVVLEYCSGGSLRELMKQRRLGEMEVWFFFRQIMNGIESVHSCGIIHRDMKPSNMLLTYPNCVLRISDFGNSMDISEVESDGEGWEKQEIIACSPAYQSPQVLQRKGDPGFRDDVYSIGVCFYFMLFGKYPFEQTVNSENTVLPLGSVTPSSLNSTGSLPRTSSLDDSISKLELIMEKIDVPSKDEDLKQLIYGMLSNDPLRRFSLNQIKRNGWYRRMEKEHEKRISTGGNLRIDLKEKNFSTKVPVNEKNGSKKENGGGSCVVM